MVVSPASTLAVEVIGGTGRVPVGPGEVGADPGPWRGEMTGAVLWCDGRRSVNLPPGARVEVRRGERPVLLARLRRHETGGPVGAGAPFTDRLVAKFGLPVTGWRGRQPRDQGLATSGRTVAEQARLAGDGPPAGPPAAGAGEEVSRGDA